MTVLMKQVAELKEQADLSQVFDTEQRKAASNILQAWFH